MVIRSSISQIATSNIAKIPTKVESTAKLLGLKGSGLHRTRVADNLHVQFIKMLEKSFEIKEKLGLRQLISLSEIESNFKKLAPGVKVQVKPLASDANYGGQVASLTSPSGKSVEGYKIELPFDYTDIGYVIKRDDFEKIDVLSHESRHFLNSITEPKKVASTVLNNMYSWKQVVGWDFYKTVLYRDETSPSGSAAEIFKQHMNEDKKARIGSIKTKIEQMFEKNYCSSSDKIALLKKWMHHLKSEEVAYKDTYLNTPTNSFKRYDAILAHVRGDTFKYTYCDKMGDKKIVDTSKFNSLDEKCRAVKAMFDERAQVSYAFNVEQSLFLPEKIKLTKKMLADEIKKVRDEQKMLFGKPEEAPSSPTFLQKVFPFLKKSD